MKLTLLARRMIQVIAVASLVFSAGGLAYYRSWEALPFAVGVLLMAALNALRVVMLERTVQRAAAQADGAAAKGQVQLAFLLRLLLTGAVLFASVKLPFIDLWGAAIGIATMPIATYATKFMKLDESNEAGE